MCFMQVQEPMLVHFTLLVLYQIFMSILGLASLFFSFFLFLFFNFVNEYKNQCNSTTHALLFSIFSTVKENRIGTIQSQSKEHLAVEISDKINLSFPTYVPPFLFCQPLVFRTWVKGHFRNFIPNPCSLPPPLFIRSNSFLL